MSRSYYNNGKYENLKCLFKIDKFDLKNCCSLFKIEWQPWKSSDIKSVFEGNHRE